MKTRDEIKEELIDRFNQMRVDGKTISDSPYFRDFVNMGFYLSAGLRGTISGVPVISNALKNLDADMTGRINKWYSAQPRALEHFQEVEKHYAKRIKAPAPKDKDCSKLLTAALDDFEKQHGFLVHGESIPNYAGFVFGNVFKEALRLKQHWKDVGAGPEHGEYTHRLQWYVLIKAGAIKAVPHSQEATVFQAIEPWQKGKTNLWTFLFDRAKNEEAIQADKKDFRSPENMNLWLVGDEDPSFCPILRAFLRARMAKRTSVYMIDQYIARKLQISAEEANEVMAAIQRDMTAKMNPSARIIFPKGSTKGELSAYVKK